MLGAYGGWRSLGVVFGSKTSIGVVEAVYLGAASYDSGVGDANKAH